MFQVIVYGAGYYIDPLSVPKSVYHKLRFLVGKFGEDLNKAPFWARHKAHMLAAKFVTTQF